MCLIVVTFAQQFSYHFLFLNKSEKLKKSCNKILTKIWVVHSFARSESLVVIIAQELVEEVKTLGRHKMLVVRVNKTLPTLARVSAKYVVEAWVELNVILVEVFKQFLRAQYFGDPDQLIVVVVTMEERLFPEYHTRKHTAQRPHVQRIIVHL